MVAFFYIVTAETMVLISGVVLALWLHKLVQHRFADWAELSGYALVFVLFPVFMYRRTSTTPDMETNLKKARESRSSPRPAGCPASHPESPCRHGRHVPVGLSAHGD